jgi:hypothetical protein
MDAGGDDSGLAGRLVSRVGRWLTVTGLAATALVLRHVGGDQAAWAAAGPLLLGGMGGGMVTSPNVTLTLASVPAPPPRRVAHARPRTPAPPSSPHLTTGRCGREASVSMGFTYRYGLFGVWRPTGSITDDHDMSAKGGEAAIVGANASRSPRSSRVALAWRESGGGLVLQSPEGSTA